ncbi:flagellar hook-associated protein FlgL [Marinobacterium arenosum]|uniref:flagellar hook-associated protein FlgL n=1 Tax=Marinobacterium arenosum TaxID=2862496 RepID=UPI001C93AE0B|nr:flagellar hook-associated protein FlgL [Marinobacterium arenosum]MBY4675928.1 flagellar hook-associated protein FlgL [Marinobacterium arenosum]
MRISTQQQYANAVRNMQRNQSNLADLQNQVATGKKFSQPSDNPLVSSQVVKLNRELSELEKYQNNVEVTQRRIELEETVLGDINTAMDRLREVTIRAGDAALNDNNRASIAAEIRQIVDSMAGLMNTKDAAGEYIFSGNKGFQQPYTQNALGRYDYNGDDGQRHIQVGSTLTVPAGDSGFELFESVAGALQISLNSDPNSDGQAELAIQNARFASTAAETQFKDYQKLNQTGDLQFEISVEQADPLSYSYRILDSGGNELQAAQSLGGALSSGPVAVNFQGLQFDLVAPPLDSLEFETSAEVSGVQAVSLTDRTAAESFAKQYGDVTINFTDDLLKEYELVSSVTGLPIDIGGTTTFNYVDNGTISYGGIEVQLGTPVTGDSFTVQAPTTNPEITRQVSNVTDVEIVDTAQFATFSTAMPVGGKMDVVFDTGAGTYELFDDGGVSLGTFNLSALPDVNLGTDPVLPSVAVDTGLKLETGTLVDGERLTINVPPRAQSTIKVEPEQKNILDVALDLAEVLETPVLSQTQRNELNDALATALDGIDEAQERITQSTAAIGSRLNTLEDIKSANEDFKLYTKTTLSNLEDADLTEVITELQLEQTLLQASQTVFGKVQSLSLFDHIR